MNPYEWRLRSCLTRQKMLNLRAIGRSQKTQNWSKMNKDSLIDRLKKDIVDSIKDFMQADDNGQVGDLQLMAYLLANHKPELPFEAERYQACFKSGQKIGSMIQELNIRGYLFELGGLDFNQLPAAIRRAPRIFIRFWSCRSRSKENVSELSMIMVLKAYIEKRFVSTEGK
jgi:hypothetical protein